MDLQLVWSGSGVAPMEIITTNLIFWRIEAEIFTTNLVFQVGEIALVVQCIIISTAGAPPQS